MPFQTLQHQLAHDYDVCCATVSTVGLNADEWPSDFKAHIDALIKKIWQNQQSPVFDENLHVTYASQLTEAVLKGFGKNITEADWNTPNYQMLNSLTTNVWQFSAAKTHTQLRDMGKALLKPDGTGFRDYKDFKIRSQQIAGTQLNWLRTEYDSAIGGAQMASKWADIQAQKHLFPLLQFDAVIDKATSAICHGLDRVIKPVDDVFWKKYYPPNHFNCRSTVRQLQDGKVTPDDKIVTPEKVPPMFAVNLGERGLVFPAGHAYYTDVPAHVVANGTLYMPVDQQYIIAYKSKDGKTVKVNRKTLAENKADLKDVLFASKVDADRGIEVSVLPEIHASEKQLRKKLLPNTNTPTVNPDRVKKYINNPIYDDVKRPEALTFESLQTRIAKGAKQADSLTFVLSEDVPASMLSDLAKDRFKAKANLKMLTFIIEDTGEIHEFIK